MNLTFERGKTKCSFGEHPHLHLQRKESLPIFERAGSGASDRETPEA
jgi:hypothetical protein